MTITTKIQQMLNDPSIVKTQTIQSLWSGYGEVARFFSSKLQQSYIVKTINFKPVTTHPRGWNTSVSHQRKITSYQVESTFYETYAPVINCQYGRRCVPSLIAKAHSHEGITLVMDDLDQFGYTQRFEMAQSHTLTAALTWLAQFHATFMKRSLNDLWSVGSYWHFETRQDEYNAMPEGEIKANAKYFSALLEQSKFKTLIHGDAKFQNFCFGLPQQPSDEQSNFQIAAVDFQYTGAGAGVKDVAYLAASSLSNDALQERHLTILDEYLNLLETALKENAVNLDFSELRSEYRRLYPIAWADYYRFLLGWDSTSFKISDYMCSMAETAIKHIE